MIKITFKNSQGIQWDEKEYTDYRYDGKCFVIINVDKWVGIYNIDSVASIVCI